MHIVNIAAELAPIAKVGGLGDVLLGLSRELSWKGHDVDIIIPKYDCINSEEIRDLGVAYQDLKCYYDGEWFNTTVWSGWVENLKVYFIEPHHSRYFFDRGCFYGCADDIERFLCFSRIALEFMYKLPLRPNIVHLHDWQTSIIPVLYQDMYKSLGMELIKTIFTIHNLEYQGKCSTDDLDKIGLNGASYLSRAKLQDTQNPSSINLLKGGIVYSDFITTVSPTYANEVLTPQNGWGLDSTLKENSYKFKGILNGLDYSFWNPEIDRYLPTHFSSREVPLNKKDRSTVSNKAYIKRTLRDYVGLEDLHRPLVGCVSRLVPQKGIELIKHALERTVQMGGQFVLLGHSPIPEIHEQFLALKHKYYESPQVALTLHHEEKLAHLIYGGSDIFIVPSIFEPCGLTQLIALKYGSVPVVRHTGGLSDTIFDIDNHKENEVGNGYVFNDPTPQDLDTALDRAILCWKENPEKWRKLMLTGMNMDYSWNKASNLYLDIYKNLLKSDTVAK